MSTIEDTWRRISGRLVEIGMPLREIGNLREGFAAGVYAAATAVILERANPTDMSEAAERIERGR